MPFTEGDPVPVAQRVPKAGWSRLGVARKDHFAVEQLREYMLNPKGLKHNARLLLMGGNHPDSVVSLDEIADWLRPGNRRNLPALLATRIAVAILDDHKNGPRGGAVARAAFTSLTPAERQAADQAIREAVEETRDEFYEGFPQFAVPPCAKALPKQPEDQDSASDEAVGYSP